MKDLTQAYFNSTRNLQLNFSDFLTLLPQFVLDSSRNWCEEDSKYRILIHPSFGDGDPLYVFNMTRLDRYSGFELSLLGVAVDAFTNWGTNHRTMAHIQPELVCSTPLCTELKRHKLQLALKVGPGINLPKRLPWPFTRLVSVGKVVQVLEISVNEKSWIFYASRQNLWSSMKYSSFQFILHLQIGLYLKFNFFNCFSGHHHHDHGTETAGESTNSQISKILKLFFTGMSARLRPPWCWKIQHLQYLKMSAERSIMQSFLLTLYFFSHAVWLISFGSVLGISVVSLLGVLAVPMLRYSKVLNYVISYLVALAVGTLSGDALLHLLPHVSSSSRRQPYPFSTLQSLASQLERRTLGLQHSWWNTPKSWSNIIIIDIIRLLDCTTTELMDTIMIMLTLTAKRRKITLTQCGKAWLHAWESIVSFSLKLAWDSCTDER